MARVTGKYDVGFERGESGWDSVFNTYLGTRLKENKEKYKRELKAADPKNAYSILSDLMKERRQLVQQMGRAQRETMKSAGGTYKRETGGRPDTDYREKMLLENREFKNDAQRGIDHASSKRSQNMINTDFAHMAKTEKSGQGISARLGTTFGNLTGDMNQYEKIGVAHILYQKVMKDPNLSKEQEKAGRLYITAQLGYVPESPRIGQKGTIRTDGNNRVLYMGLNTEDELAARRLEGSSGGPKVTVTRPMGGMDPSEVSAAYKPYLENLDAQIKTAREDWEIAKREYKGMIKGPGYNMALAPLSSRPSALSQSLSKYGRLREVDPSYTREAMTASEEEGMFVLPTPYEELSSIEGAGGESPMTLLLSTTDNLRTFRGLGTDAGEPRKERDLTEEEADRAEGSVSQMLAGLNSPLYKGAEYGGVREILERHKNAFKAAKGFDEVKILVANQLADELSGWEGSLSQDRLAEITNKSQPAFRVADAIRKSQAAYDTFLKTRDAEQYRAEISKTYNDLLNTPAEQRGLVGDAYLNEIERYESVDPSRRLPEHLNFKLQGLLQSADKIAARNALTPGYGGDLPERGPRSELPSVTGLGSEQETEV